MKLDGSRRRTVDRFVSVGKVHFLKMLSVTLTFEQMTLKCHLCHVDMVMNNFDKFH